MATQKTARKQKELLTPEQAGEVFTELKRDIANLISFASHIGREGKVEGTLEGEKDVTTFTSQSVKSFRSLINKNIDELFSQYKLALRGRRGAPKRKSGETRIPGLVKLIDTYRNFWAGANLGLSNPNDSRSASLASSVPLLTKKGITSPGMLTSLWTTYVDVNNLKTVGPDGKQNRLRADDYMNRILGRAFDHLERNTPTPEALDNYNEKVASGKKKAEKPEKFDRNSFNRKWLANISSMYMVLGPDDESSPTKLAGKKAVGNDRPLTADEKENLKMDTELRKQVQDEVEVSKAARGGAVDEE